MKKISLYLILGMVILFLLTGCTKKKGKEDSDTVNQSGEIKGKTAELNDIEIEVDYHAYFNENDGCAVFYDKKNKTYYVYNKELSEKRSSPCSSFKIISCLLGIESGVIDPEDSVRKWNGTIYPIEAWNKDINYIDAFHSSCIWYYRQILDSVGMDYVQKALDQLKYGNCDISEWEGSFNNMIFPDQKDLKELNGFWQESSLQISPREQVDIVKRIFDEYEFFNRDNIALVKSVMHIDNNNLDIQVYGKTGSGIKDDVWNDGWFVGLFELKDNTFYFAVRLNQPGKRGNDAKETALKIINQEFNN